MGNHNIMLMTDSYKSTHYNFYPKGTTYVYSYMEARGGRFDKAVFFGLQYYMKRYLEGVQVTPEKIDEAERFWNSHFGFTRFNRAGWEHILNAHGGRLPIRIKAVPEGTVVDVSNVLMTIENTDPECFWLTNFVETLLMKLWAPITVATNSAYLRLRITEAAVRTTGDLAVARGFADYAMHDFGYRGVSSEETAGILGAAHLLSFRGTDTAAAVRMLQDYYDGGEAGGIGNSVDATEHSVMCAFGADDELGAIRNAIQSAVTETGAPVPIVSIVSDTYDIYNACDAYYGTELKDLILSRATPDGTPAKVVVRPDSGDPKKVLLGDPDATDPLVREGVLRILYRHFPGKTNANGYKTLDPHVGIIQGDGVDAETTVDILRGMEEMGFCATNVVFGSGGGLLQKFDRDTMKFAIKASYAVVDGEKRDLIKSPVTSPGKRSKSGRLKLIRTPDAPGYATVNDTGVDNALSPYVQVDGGDDVMQYVFNNGQILRHETLADLRERLR